MVSQLMTLAVNVPSIAALPIVVLLLTVMTLVDKAVAISFTRVSQ
jgi:hypothetical protein